MRTPMCVRVRLYRTYKPNVTTAGALYIVNIFRISFEFHDWIGIRLYGNFKFARGVDGRCIIISTGYGAGEMFLKNPNADISNYMLTNTSTYYIIFFRRYNTWCFFFWFWTQFRIDMEYILDGIKEKLLYFTFRRCRTLRTKRVQFECPAEILAITLTAINTSTHQHRRGRLQNIIYERFFFTRLSRGY